MNFQQIRSATIKITYAGKTFLIDPWLAPRFTSGCLAMIPMMCAMNSGGDPRKKYVFDECSTWEAVKPKHKWLPCPLHSLPMSVKKVNEGVDAYIYLDSRCSYTGRLYGKGTLRVNVPYVRSYLQGNWSAFEGTLVTLNSGQTFSFDNGYGLPKAVLNVPEGVYVGNSGKSFEIGKVTGAGSLGGLCLDYSSGVNTWKIGSLNEDFTFSAVITGTGTMFEKVGTGKMTVNSASDFTGTCTVSAGTLCLNNTSAEKAMMGTGALTVKDGATLCGVGKLGNSSVKVERGGVLYPGTRETAMAGTLDFSGKSLSVSSGAVLQFNIGSKTRCTNLENLSSLTLRGTLKVSVREGLELEPGIEYTLWEANRTTLSDGVELELASPGAGLEWDTTDLESGILRVKEGMGVEAVLADEPVDCEAYTVGGAAAGRFTCARRDIRRTMEAEGYAPGVYTVKVRHGASVSVLKITVD